MNPEEIEAKASKLEREAREKVSNSLSKLEIAISEWDASKKKPKSLGRRIEYFRASHKLLSEWAKQSLKGKADFISIIRRLREFTAICEKL